MILMLSMLVLDSYTVTKYDMFMFHLLLLIPSAHSTLELMHSRSIYFIFAHCSHYILPMPPSSITSTAHPRPQKQFPKNQKKVKLSAHTQKAITVKQRAKCMAFDADVAAIWSNNIEACQKLAEKHHKTLHRCQDAIYLGAKMMTGGHKKVSNWSAYVAAMVKQINESL